jgi:hypothetical protein
MIQNTLSHKKAVAALDTLNLYANRLAKLEPSLCIVDRLEELFPYMFAYSYFNHDYLCIKAEFNFLSMVDARKVLRYVVKECHLTQVEVTKGNPYVYWKFDGIIISGNFSSPDATCTFVKTGTKEVDTFDMVCKGNQNPVEALDISEEV